MRLFRALLVALALLAPATRADFTTEHLIHQYDLHIGNPDNCLSSVEVTDDDLMLTYGDLNLNGDRCEEGYLVFQVNGDAKPFSDLFRTDLESYGTYIGAQTALRLECGNNAFIDKDTPVAFFRPNVRMKPTVSDFFGDDAANDLGDEVQPDDELLLEKDVKYLVIGQRCLFRAVSTSFGACFPTGAKVMANGPSSPVAIQNVRIGDRVRTGPASHSKVFSWSHRDGTVVSDFMRISTASGAALTVSPSHFVPIIVSGVRHVVQAREIATNGSLVAADGSLHAVTGVRKVTKEGLYNPHTVDGSIVVDGFVVSTFTAAFDAPKTAHAALAPIRAAFSSVFGSGVYAHIESAFSRGCQAFQR